MDDNTRNPEQDDQPVQVARKQTINDLRYQITQLPYIWYLSFTLYALSLGSFSPFFSLISIIGIVCIFLSLLSFASFVFFIPRFFRVFYLYALENGFPALVKDIRSLQFDKPQKIAMAIVFVYFLIIFVVLVLFVASNLLLNITIRPSIILSIARFPIWIILYLDAYLLLNYKTNILKKFSIPQTTLTKSIFNSLVGILVLIPFCLTSLVVYSAFYSRIHPAKVACTAEAKICPDGTTVGRSGPTCEFTKCPPQKTTATNNDAETARWKTYTNTKIGYTIKYPPSFTEPNVPCASFCLANGTEENTLISFYDKNSNGYSLTAFKSMSTLEQIVKERQTATTFSDIVPQFFPDKPIKSLKTTTIDGITTYWYSTDHINKDGSSGVDIYFFQNGYAFIFRAGEFSKINQKQLDGMLSTFKFTNQNQTSDNSNWNDGVIGNLTFKYPSQYHGGYVCGNKSEFFIDTGPIPQQCPYGDDTPAFNLGFTKNETLAQAKKDFLSKTGRIDQTTKDIVIDGRASLETKEVWPPGQDVVNHNNWAIYIADGQDLYGFYSFDLHIKAADQEKYFDQIASTFKFTK
ncbi:MAG TPA: hypothetical protein VG965_04045 [Patescibacteria group bacterium]|nr:hypothetical protein [Patescibacteria group bacterium]